MTLPASTVDSGDHYYTHEHWPGIEAAPGVQRRVLSCGDQMMIVQFTIEAEAEVPLHTHPHEQIGHIVSGRMHMRIGDEVREIGPGDGYAVPGGVPHGAVGITRVIAVDTFHPVRDDYR